MKRRSFLFNLGGASAGAVAVAAGLPVHAATHQGKFKILSAAEKRRSLFANPTLITHEGKAVRFYEDLIKDKTVMLNFMFTTCTDSCPMTTANLARAQEGFRGRLGKDVFMYSISLDPEHDTPERLAAYRKHFKAGPGWTFLTGNKADIDALRRSVGFYYADGQRDADKTQHVGMLKYGIEPLGRWAACPTMSNPKVIAQYVGWLEPNGLRPDEAINMPAPAA